MNLFMCAEVFRDGLWHWIEAPIFESALPEMQGYLTNRVCDDHNYVLFEVLTGKHFKENDKYAGIPYINAKPSYPFTISDKIKDKFVKSDRSYTLYLRDIMNFNWNTVISKKGLVSEWQYRRMKKKGIAPAATNRVVFDNEAEIVNQFQMDMILANDSLRKANKYYVNIEFSPTPLREYCKFFCDVSIPALAKLIPEGGSAADVRVIYTIK